MKGSGMAGRTISIIIPVYRLEKYIKTTLDCVRAQTDQDWELILVDDCGGDGSAEIIERYVEETGDSRIRLLHLPENQGPAEARNRGVENSTGRFIAFLDGDDIWRPEKLAHQRAFQEQTGAAFVFTGYEFADETGAGLGKVVRVPEKLTYKEALKNTTIFTSTVMFDTEQIPREKIRMPRMKSEDTALWWRLLREGAVACGLDENLVLYRRPPKSLSSNKLEAVRRIWNLYRRAEHLSVLRSAYYFCFWAFRAVRRRL